MPFQNRVHPSGAIVAHESRGTFMGNRGCLHNAQQQIVKNYQLKRWIYCLLEYKGWHRAIMQPNRYTELFFLDEFTALAAGHRPCALCQPKRYQTFKTLWQEAHGVGKVSIDEIDAHLHQERTQKTTPLLAYTLDTLPAGVMVRQEEAYYLWHQNQLHEWDFTDYTPVAPSLLAPLFTLVTPLSIVKTIEAGFSLTRH